MKSNETIFQKIIKGEIPCVKIHEDEICLVIMDKFPTIEGQCLVIPKNPEDYAFNLDDEIYKHIFLIAKKIAKALDQALKTERTCLVVEGFEVPHAHIKLYPTKNKHLTISGGVEKTNEELEILAKKIKTYL